jgi:translation initiation factor IF-2
MGNVAAKDKVVELPAAITVRDLAQMMKASPIDVIKVLMSNGTMVNINQQIDFDTAAIVCAEMGFEAQPIAPPEEEKQEAEAEAPAWRRFAQDEDPSKLKLRPPVVTVMGHVDHGKTSLLDAIRHAEVAAGEVGGITQHIGAYQVVHNGRKITFLDTPGHEAFTAMRARGAQATDIVVLVVAADDGIMPQTREAIAHARAARVAIIVALNKIDKANANPEQVKQQLAEAGLMPDDWGGDTMVVPVSARQRKGIDDLLEAIVLTADAAEGIKANPDGRGAGTVIESELDKQKGPVATLLVQNGTLRVGDAIVAGGAWGKLRAMFDDRGKPIKQAGPSTPVSVMGLSAVPVAGDLFAVQPDERAARSAASANRDRMAEAAASARGPALTLDALYARFQAGQAKELALIIKADVQGSLEPIVESLTRLSTDELKVNVLLKATGTISESDVMLAAASGAIIIGFTVDADAAARRRAEAEGVDIRTYQIIYKLIDDVEKALKGMLEPKYELVSIGRAEVRQVFKISRVGVIAGSQVLDGEIRRGATARVWRGDKQLAESTIGSLKRHTEDVREVRQGYECGIGVDGFDDFQTGDVIEALVQQRVG